MPYFWIIGKAEKKGAANLSIEYASLSCSVEVQLGAGDKRKRESEPELPEIPIMVNTSQIKKHTLLLVEPDTYLKKVADEAQAAAIKEKELKAKDKAKATAKEEEEGGDETPKKAAKKG